MKKYEDIKLSDHITSTPIRVDANASLLVKGIENWIDQLIPVVDIIGCGNNGTYLRMKDVDTGAVFEIRKVI